MDQRNLVSHGQRTRSLFSARKVALMASVVTGLAIYGMSASPDRIDVFGSAAHAQSASAVSATSPWALPTWWSG